MADAPVTIDEAISNYDSAADAGAVQMADEERQEVVTRFPLNAWASLPLEQYALGQSNTHDTFCWRVEFGTPHAGSIRGGSARKHLIYRKRDGTWYYDQQSYADENEAWFAVRGAFNDAFSKAASGDWDSIDDIAAISGAAALRSKALYCYFPDQLLPIGSSAHVRHFLRALGYDEAKLSGLGAVRLNRELLQTVRKSPEVAGWNNKQIERLLYRWADPRDQRQVVKIAPGEDAEFWDECLKNGYICVGWDDVGDLRQFDSEESFRVRFNETCGHIHKNHQSTLTKKAKEVWMLHELQEGDFVVANKGTSKVLAVGEVVEPGYEWDEQRTKFKHLVRLKWDTSYAQDVPPQPKWAFATVATVPQGLSAQILSKKNVTGSTNGGTGGKAPTPPKPVPVDPLFKEIADALERKGQAILYGPPGTGKTFCARRFSVWWVLREGGDPAPEHPLGEKKSFDDAERKLSLGERGGVGRITRLTFHPSYSYEDFIEGFRPVEATGGNLALRLEDGIFKRVCREAQAHPHKPYLVLIDEINRANVAKVFGELITLLERDKRGLLISLPQSKEPFTIPPNMYVLGTMNTADRSIKLLDAALRRRFAFIELMPDPSLLEGGKVYNLALDDFLAELNRRIAAKEGREKQIGHSFLLDGDGPVTDPEEFARRFRQEILPLLQEYCYDDYRVLATYIGQKLVKVEAQVLNEDVLLKADSLVAALEEEFAGKGAAS